MQRNNMRWERIRIKERMRKSRKRRMEMMKIRWKAKESRGGGAILEKGQE